MRSMKSKTVDRFRWLILSANISVTIFIGALVIQQYSRDSMVVPRLPDPREGARTLRSKRVQYADFAAQVALAVAPAPKSAAPKRKPKEPEKKTDHGGPLALLFEFEGGMFYGHGSARNFAWLEPRQDQVCEPPPRPRGVRRNPRPTRNRTNGKLLRTGDRWEVPESDGVSLRVLEIGPNGLTYAVEATGEVPSLHRRTTEHWWREKDGHVTIDPGAR